tara:strand:+ start:767 stop:925 length:159 start_codon:yes stop_codon:yes gene_type:complete
MPFVYDYNQYISGVLIGLIIFSFLGFIRVLRIKAPAVAVVKIDKKICVMLTV